MKTRISAKIQHLLCLALALPIMYPTDSLATTDMPVATISKQIKELVAAQEVQLQQIRKQAAADPEQYLPALITAINQLGNIYHYENHNLQAHAAYAEALQLCEKAEADKPGKYLAQLYMLLNNQALLFETEKNWTQAILFNEKAAAVSRLQVAKASETYLPQLTTVLYNLANLYRDQRLTTEAKAAYVEVIAHCRELIKKDAASYEPFLAFASFYLGLIHYGEENYAAAQPLLEVSLPLYRAAITRDPSLKKELAIVLGNLGHIAMLEQNYAQARLLLDEAYRVYPKVKVSNPGFLYSYATTLTDLGELKQMENRETHAQILYEEAISIYRQLPARHLEIVRPLFAAALTELGNSYAQARLTDKARVVFEEAAEQWRKLATVQPDPYALNLAGMQVQLGLIYVHQNKSLQAQTAFEEASNLYAAVRPEKLPDVLSDHILALSQLIRLSKAEKRERDTLNSYTRLAPLLRLQVKLYPKTEQHLLANVLNNMAELLAYNRQLVQARPLVKEAISIYQQLPDKHVGDFSELAAAINNLGLIEQEEHQLADALKAFSESAAILKQQKQLNSDEQKKLATVLLSMSNMALLTNKKTGAQQHSNEALNILRTLVKDQARYTPDLINALLQASDLHFASQKSEQARAAYEEIASLASRSAPLSPQLKARVEKLKLAVNKSVEK